MSDGLLRSGSRNWTGPTRTSGEFSQLLRQPFNPSPPGRHRPSPLAAEFPHLAGRGERAARPPRRVPNSRGMLRRPGRLFGPYGWIFDLPGLLEDIQTTGEWLWQDWDWARTMPVDYHSNFQLIRSGDGSLPSCVGSITTNLYGVEAILFNVPASLPHCNASNPYFATFELAAASSFADTVGEYVTWQPRRSISTGPMARLWRRIAAGPTVPYVVQPMNHPSPGPLAEPMEKEYPQPETAALPGVKAWERSPSIDFTPDGPPGGTPGEHENLPPKRPNQEVKKKMDMGVAGQIYGELTEFRDMMDCFAEASGMKKPKGTIGKRARAIYEHLNATNPDGTPKNPIDTWKFAKCMALANAKDFAIGKLSNETAKNLNRSPYVASRPGGYRGGGWGTRMLNLGG